MSDPQWELVQLMCAFSSTERVDIALMVEKLVELAFNETQASRTVHD